MSARADFASFRPQSRLRHEGVLERATAIMVADMRRRLLLSIRWKRSCRRLSSAIASQ